MGKKLRRDRDTLIIGGMGVLIFGCWSLLKNIVIFFLAPERYISPETAEQIPRLLGVVVGVLLIVLLSLPRFYVGRSARSEGMGHGVKGYYVIVALLIMAFDLAGIVRDVMDLFSGGGEDGMLNLEAALVIDITSLLVLFDMTLAAMRLRHMKRWLAGHG